jgi:hypothetical protein
MPSMNGTGLSDRKEAAIGIARIVNAVGATAKVNWISGKKPLKRRPSAGSGQKKPRRNGGQK